MFVVAIAFGTALYLMPSLMFYWMAALVRGEAPRLLEGTEP